MQPGAEAEKVKKEIIERLPELYDERFKRVVIKKVRTSPYTKPTDSWEYYIYRKNGNLTKKGKPKRFI